jgi:rod shape-determining protein MreD
MNQLIFKNMLIILALAAGDTILVNRLSLGTLITPYIYHFFIIQLPVRTSRHALIFLGFFTGLFFDIIYHTGGAHAAATCFLALLRIAVLPAFISTEDKDNNISPGIYTLGQAVFLIYSMILTLGHHILLFNLEIFNKSAIPLTLLKALVSSIFSVFLIYLLCLLFYRKKRL